MNSDSWHDTDDDSTQFETSEIQGNAQAADEAGFLIPNENDLSQANQDRERFEPWLYNFEIPGYEIHEIIGRGGASIVYRATEEADPNVTVAIKVLRESIDEQHIRFRFDREVDSLKRLRHPCIARLKHAGISDSGQPFLVLEYIDGQRIDRYCQHHKLSIRDRVQLFLDVCDAVQFAHQNNILHRDIKPANILVDENGHPFLTDFGLAKLVESDESNSEKTRTGVVLGTLNYLAPEQVFGMKNPVSPALDVFGLGAVLHVLLTDRPLFRFENLVDATREYFKRLPVKLGSDHDIPSSLEAICIKCLAPKPADRYATAGDVAEELMRYLDGHSVSARSNSMRRRFSLLVKQYPWLVQSSVVAFSLIAIAVIAVCFLWRSSTHSLETAKQLAENTRLTNIDLANEVRTLERSPKTLGVRGRLLQNVLTSFSRLESDYEIDLDSLFQIAQSNFKLGQVENHLGKYQTNRWNNSERGFLEIVNLQPNHEKARFGLFHSQNALYKHDAALETIAQLCNDYPDNTDYVDALCNTKFSIARHLIIDYRFNESKPIIQEQFVLTDRLAKYVDSDGRFRRKLADAKMLQAQLQVTENHLDEAQETLNEVLRIYQGLDPTSLATHGESREYIDRLGFAISVAAFRKDHSLVGELKSELDSFFVAAQKRFSNFESIYYEQCEVLETYAAYCSCFDLTGQTEFVANQWRAVLDQWEECIEEPSANYQTCSIEYFGSPFLLTHDLERTSEMLDRLPSRSCPPLVQGCGFLRVGEIDRAREHYQLYRSENPGSVVASAYRRLIDHIAKNDESHVSVQEVSNRDQLKILGATRSFPLAKLHERQTLEMELFRQNHRASQKSTVPLN